MRSRSFFVGFVALLVSLPAAALAQEAPVSDAPREGTASGFMLQGVLPTGVLTSSSLLSSNMRVGFRGDRFSVAAQLGLSALHTGSGDTSIDGTILSIMPVASYDLWQSRNGRARFGVLGGVGIARLGVTVEETSGTTTRSNEVSAMVLPLQVAVSGDYYLSRNFALGLEGGYQGAILLSAKSGDTDVDLDLGLHGLYGAIRATFVVGD